MGLFVASSHSRIRKVMTKLAILSSGLCLSVCPEWLGVFHRSTKTQFCSQEHKNPVLFSEAQKTSFCSRHIRMGMIWACEILFSSSSLLQ
jgi:hypothetical protein